MSKTRSLIRTNPKLTSNYRLTVTDSALYLNSIVGIPNIADNSFKDYKLTNDGADFANDLSAFWKRGITPNSIIFQNYQRDKSETVVPDPFRQFERTYHYGAERVLSKAIKERLAIFAPLLIGDKIPSHFIVFKLKGLKDTSLEPVSSLEIGLSYMVSIGSIKSDGIIYVASQEFTATSTTFTLLEQGSQVVLRDEIFEQSLNNMGYLLENAEILKVYDLNNSKVGSMITSLTSSKNYKKSPVNVDFKNKEITYSGIDIYSGVITSKTESIEKPLEEFLQIINFDEFITNGFERNGVASCSILNLEFCFDDNTENSFGRYFGLYLDEYTIGKVPINSDITIRDQLGIKVDYNTLNYNYDQKLNVTSLLITEKPNNVHKFNQEELKKDSFHFYKTDKNKFLKVNKNGDTTCNSFMLSDLFSFSEASSIKAEVVEKGPDSTTITVDKEFDVTNTLYVSNSNITIGFVIADDLLDYQINNPYGVGDSVGYYFYPKGTFRQIAKAMSNALNYALKGTLLRATYYENKVVIYTIANNSYDGRFAIHSGSSNFNFSSKELVCGSNFSHTRFKIKNTLLKNISVDSYIKTDLGYSRVEAITPYPDDVIFATEDHLKDSILDYSALSLRDESAKASMQDESVFVYNISELSKGFFSFISIEDFDTDTESNEYSFFPKNEYYKYFGARSGDLIIKNGASAYLRIKKRGANNILNTINVQADDGFLPLNFGTYVVNDTSSIKMAANMVDLFSLAITSPILEITNDGNIIKFKFPDSQGASSNLYKLLIVNNPLYDTIFEISDFDGGNDGEEYIILNGDYQQAIIEYEGVIYGTGGIWESNPISQQFFANINKNFTIINGNPILIPMKFFLDRENVFADPNVLSFIGFNTLDYKNPTLDNTLENKLKLLDTNSNEYEYSLENRLVKNLYKDKINPIISKWVKQDGKDIRDNGYRLNTSLAFGEFNFSPSFVDEVPNPVYFTHEWSYLSRLPQVINDEEIINNKNYFNGNFNEELYLNQFEDYFQDYFTVSDLADLEVKFQKRFSKFQKNGSISETFFKGIKIQVKDIDLTDCKFSVLTNFYKTKQYERKDPIAIKVIYNKDHNNILFLIDVVIDDYKINPYDGRVFGEYSFFYLGKDLKKYDYSLSTFLDGIEFQYPTIPTITFVTSPITTPPSFRGIQINSKFRRKFNNDIETLEFNGDKIKLFNIVKENGDKDFGDIYGINPVDGTFLSTTINSFAYPFYGDSSGAKQIKSVINDFVELNPNGLYGLTVASVPIYLSATVSAFESFYYLPNLIWFQKGGGKNYYTDLLKLVSFAKLRDFIENKHPIVDFYAIENGVMMQSFLDIKFLEKDSIDKINGIKLDKTYVVEGELNNRTFESIVESIVESPNKIYRYSDDYEPKTKPIFNFRANKITRGWNYWNYTWNQLGDYTWNTFFKKKISYEDIFESDINLSVDKENNSVKDFFHMLSDSDDLILNRNYPEIGQYAIKSLNLSVFRDRFENNFFLKTILGVDENYHGLKDVTEIKNYFKTLLFNSQEQFYKTIVNYNTTINNEAILLDEETLITITIDVVQVFTNQFYQAIKTEFLKYFFESDVDNLDLWIKNYIEVNLFGLYDLKSIRIYRKEGNADIQRINTETNDLVLVGNGYTIDSSSEVIKTEKSVIIKIKKKIETNSSINIKLDFNYK